MSSEVCSPGHERLNNIVVSLEMEISDSILLALRKEAASCREEQEERLGTVGPVLQGMEAVIRHIDEFRMFTDARALSLFRELVQAYKELTEEPPEESAALVIASEALNKVLSWQHSCIQESLKKARSTTEPEPAGSPVKALSPASDMQGMQGMLDAVRKEIAATGMMVIRESGALLELVHVRNVRNKAKKTAEGSVSAASEETEAIKAGQGEEFSAVIRENIFSLQQALHQEIGRLRHDFIGEQFNLP
ncbi:MAG: hypothetical protein D3906_04380 [Candidatus Electrothrix sp. AUS1_2]|nr:hypothetical protein [Candidatus Electrothrix sp. AUS1_2]